jgi:hypothetical protein
MNGKIARCLCVVAMAMMLSTGLSGTISGAVHRPSFAMDVCTRPLGAEISDPIVYQAIPGQRCLFLVTVSNLTGGVDSVDVCGFVNREHGAPVRVYQRAVAAGQVAEIEVVPRRADVNTNLVLVIRGAVRGFSQTETVYIEVVDQTDDRREEATQIREYFEPWIAENFPELGISDCTHWKATIVRPVWLVVMHYMFLSDEWEMYVTWHVMIPPYDWAHVYLRHRYTDTAVSFEFEDSSRSDDIGPIVIDPPLEP